MLTLRRVNFFILFFLGSFFLPRDVFASAENLNLGSYTEQTAQEKFFQNISLKINSSSRNLTAADVRKWFTTKEDLAYNPGYVSEIENGHFCAYKKSFICDLLFTSQQDAHIQKLSQLYLDTGLISQFLEDLAGQINRDPENARLQAEGGKVSVFALSTDGIKLDKEKSLQNIVRYFTENSATGKIDLAYDLTKPEISTDSIDNLGITSLIGEGVSNFAGSPKNRVHNLTLGAQKFNGVLIKPGENFSFLKTLGPVDESTGYLPELVIIGNETKPDFGGGMCQVSTTAFRAAIYSGLKITSRTPHAYPVSYYNPQGMDATVFIPNPDLKFTNNTPNYILIQTRIEGTKLFFDFYGTDDGRKTTVIGPTITDRQPDGSMKAAFTQEVVDKNGVALITQVFKSDYDSPFNHPHPGQAPLTSKPANWSKDQWKQYKKDNHL